MLPNSRVSRSTLIDRSEERLDRMRLFIGSVIENVDTKARFRITDVHLRAADGVPQFTYISIGRDEHLPFSRPASEILDGRQYRFHSGAYRPVKRKRADFVPRHVLEI